MSYPREFAHAPNWPVEMVCPVCRFRGWQWLGMTKLMFNLLSRDHKWHRCGGCGAGILEMTSEKVPVFILKVD